MSDIDVYKEIQIICKNSLKKLEELNDYGAKNFAILTLIQIEAMASTIILIEKCDINENP